MVRFLSASKAVAWRSLFLFSVILFTGPTLAATLENIRFGQHTAATRMVLDFSTAAAPNIQLAADGKSAQITLPESERGAKLSPSGKALGLVAGYAVSDSAADILLTLSFKAPVQIAKKFALPAKNGRGDRYVIDFQKAGAPKAKAKPAKAAPPPAKPQPVTPAAAPTPAPENRLEDQLHKAERLMQTAQNEETVSEAIALYRGVALAGSTPAQLKMGYFYIKGIGVPKNASEATIWFHRAAIGGDAIAAYNLGQIYRTGAGGPPDYAAAAQWYALAADQGHAQSLYNLSIMYLKGLGVALDRDRGYELIAQAADLGLPSAVRLKDDLAKEFGE
ncbi:MAG: tetratricopeptide repeat protein [Magnetospiraceae bacterium]